MKDESHLSQHVSAEQAGPQWKVWPCVVSLCVWEVCARVHTLQCFPCEGAAPDSVNKSLGVPREQICELYTVQNILKMKLCRVYAAQRSVGGCTTGSIRAPWLHFLLWPLEADTVLTPVFNINEKKKKTRLQRGTKTDHFTHGKIVAAIIKVL